MKAKLDDLVDRIRNWTDTATEKAGVISRAAAAKAEELSKVGKLKMDIYQLRRELSRLYADLGRLAYQSLEGKSGGTLADQPGVDDLLSRISGLLDDISVKESELEKASRAEESIDEVPPAKKEDIPEKKDIPGKKENSDAMSGKKTASTQKSKSTAKSPATKKGGNKKSTATAKKTKSRKPTKPAGTS